MKATGAVENAPDRPSLRWGLSFAHGYFELGMLEKAEKELNRLGSQSQDLPEVMAMRLRVLLARRAWPRVIETARHAVRLFPNVPEFYVHAAAAYDMLGQGDQRRLLWQTAPEKVRTSGILHLHMARFEASLGNLDSAREHLRSALNLEPGLRAIAGNDPGLSGMISENAEN
jgi:tetratricopeptide (TPR) repeat protein